ncbi:hypothetical protein CHELA1G2_13973 [Hyphomicrobiales bacterium]|jgi:hypothetical protein|nr:hypothetical protein CHELA1G2_13973 [Hyphomicrobiales bacterium]
MNALARLGLVRPMIEKVDLGPYGEDAGDNLPPEPAGREWLVWAGLLPPGWCPVEGRGLQWPIIRRRWEERTGRSLFPERASRRRGHEKEKVAGGCTV